VATCILNTPRTAELRARIEKNRKNTVAVSVVTKGKNYDKSSAKRNFSKKRGKERSSEPEKKDPELRHGQQGDRKGRLATRRKQE